MASALAKLASAPGWLAGWCKSHKIISAGILVVIIVSVAGVMYERDRRWQASFTLALQELNAAIASGNLDVLAKRVDFIALSRHAAREVMLNMDLSPTGPYGPQLPDTMRTDPTQLRAMEEAIQKRLIRLFTEKPTEIPGEAPAQPKKEAPKGEEVPEAQRGPLYDKAQSLLADAKKEASKSSSRAAEPPNPDALKEPPAFPGNLLTQLHENPFVVRNESQTEALVTCKVKHPQANMNVTLNLHATNTPMGWRFDRLNGVGDMVRVYMAELRNFHLNREALFHARNAQTLELMNRTAKVLDCEALLASERPDGSVVMLLRVNGLNSGEDTFTAASITCRLYDGPDNEVLKQNFGLTQTVKPGKNFRIDFVQEYEEDEPVAVILRREKRLVCVPNVSSITLEAGRLLYVRPFMRYTESR